MKRLAECCYKLAAPVKYPSVFFEIEQGRQTHTETHGHEKAQSSRLKAKGGRIEAGRLGGSEAEGGGIRNGEVTKDEG